MQKILFVCNDGYNTTNTRIRCYRFSSELLKRGIASAVFSYKDHLHASHEGFESYKTPIFERFTLLLRAIQALSQEKKSTVFYVQKAGYFAIAPLVVSLMRGNRLILDYDDYEFEQSPISRCLLKTLAKRAVFCVAASSYLQTLLKRFNSKVYHLPTGVDTQIFRPKKPIKSGKQIVFSWVGFVVDKAAAENIMFIIDSFNEYTLKQKQKTNKSIARLEIVGGGKHISEIVEHIESLNNSRIIYKGTLPPDKIPSYLNSVDVGLFILTKDTKYNRSKSPTKLFEYMAKGLAIISTELGESGNIIHDNQNGILVRNGGDLVKKIEQLANNPRLVHTLGKNAVYSSSKSYSLDVIGSQLVQIMQKEIPDD